MTLLISRGQVPISRYITSICNYQQVFPTMRKVVPYLSFSSSCTWYISSESDIFSVYPISILGFVSLYRGYILLSLYMQCIYQGYTIIYSRICKFIQWIYFVFGSLPGVPVCSNLISRGEGALPSCRPHVVDSSTQRRSPMQCSYSSR